MTRSFRAFRGKRTAIILLTFGRNHGSEMGAELKSNMSSEMQRSMLLALAARVRVFRKDYQPAQAFLDVKSDVMSGLRATVPLSLDAGRRNGPDDGENAAQKTEHIPDPPA